jgi:cell division inhibitor SepF
MVKDLWGRFTSYMRDGILSPGFKDYDPDNPEYTYDMHEEDEPQAEKTWQEHARTAAAPKSFKHGKYGDKIVELYGKKSQSDKNTQVVLTNPKDISNSNIVTDYIKDGKICAVNLTAVDRDQAQRIVDAVAGAVYALEGSIQRVSKDIFIVAPEGVLITGELKEELSHGLPWASSR